MSVKIESFVTKYLDFTIRSRRQDRDGSCLRERKEAHITWNCCDEHRALAAIGKQLREEAARLHVCEDGSMAMSPNWWNELNEPELARIADTQLDPEQYVRGR